MKIKQLINNELVLGDGPNEKIINPFNSEIITEIPQSSIEQVELATQSAKSAFPAWSRTTPADRSAMLLKVADMIEQNAEEIARLKKLLPSFGTLPNQNRSLLEQMRERSDSLLGLK